MSQPFSDRLYPGTSSLSSRASINTQRLSRFLTRWSPYALLLLVCYVVFYDSPSCDMPIPVDPVNEKMKESRAGGLGAVADWAWEHKRRVQGSRLKQSLQERESKQEKESVEVLNLARLALETKPPQKPYKMVMCTRIWNEAKYLDEWICRYYRLCASPRD